MCCPAGGQGSLIIWMIALPGPLHAVLRCSNHRHNRHRFPRRCGITSYTETEDARFLITLTGLCRFRIMRELDAMTPYRQVEADFEPFADDLTAEDDDLLEEGVRERLLNALKGYLTQQKMRADWESIQHAPAEHLINALAMICPFETSEKQALLEAPTLPERAQTLITLISMSGNEPSPGEDNGTLQ